MYAIVEIAGKQFRVAKDMKLKVPVIQGDAGKNVDFDVAVSMKPAIDEFLQQAIREDANFHSSHDRLLTLAQKINALRQDLAVKMNPAQPVAEKVQAVEEK